MSIGSLSQASSVAAGDQVVIYQGSSSQYMAVTVANLAASMQSLLVSTSGSNKQYFAPSASGQTITIAQNSVYPNTWAIVSPLSGYAALTITLPPLAGLVDQQEILFEITQSITTITWALNGAATSVGLPTTATGPAYFRLKFDAITATWYRVN